MFTISHLLVIAISLSSHLSDADQLLSTSSSDRHNLTCEQLCELSGAAKPRLEVKKDFFVREPNKTAELHATVKDVRSVERNHVTRPSSERYLGMSSIIFGLSRIANEAYLSEQCFSDFKSIERGILRRDPWAMKVLDSSGGKESGFIWGQNYWLGSQQGCAAVQNPVRITLSNQFQRTMKDGLIEQMAPFKMDYRVVYMKHNSPWQVEIKFMTERIIHVGLCLPSSCSSYEIHNITQTLMDESLLEEGNVFDLNSEVMYIKDLKVKDSFFDKKSLKIIAAVLVFTAAMMLAASCLNVSEPISAEKHTDGSFPAVGQKTNEKEIKSSSLVTFIKCFDIANNCRALFTFRESTPNSIPVINGLRSVSCIWIMLFHVVWYMYFTVDNKTFLISYGEKAFFQYVSTSPLLVDLFFTISGFLQTYNFLKNDKQLDVVKGNTLGQNVKVFTKMLFHRYLRLAPLYLVLTGMVEIFTSYIEDVSIFHIHDRFDQTCSNHWWRNIIFVQNFFDHKELCLNWTWSLACEMQFFCLISILLFVYTKHPRLVKNLVAGSVVATIVWTYIVGLESRYQLSFDVAYHTATEIYINPFIRIMPYLLGSICGWYLVQSKGQFQMGSMAEKCIWNMAILLFFACIYSTIKRDMTFLQTISLLVVGRLLFSISVCWMIIGSATGRGSWWSRILECKIFQHLNRLSYAIYLLNPFVIAFIFSLSNTSSHADPLQLCVLSSGFVAIVYIVSIVFSLAFEMPYCNWSYELLRKKLKTA